MHKRACAVRCWGLIVALLLAGGAARATDFDFLDREFTWDSDVALIDFTVAEDSDVTLFTSSWLRGDPPAGFDPVLGLWGADGAYHQQWVYADCGITLGMVSEKKGARKSIESITVVSPSDLGTKSGIRIGSTEQEVMKAYASHWNKEDSSPSKTFVAGSVYGGLMFDFDAGKVSRIFVGAAAE